MRVGTAIFISAFMAAAPVAAQSCGPAAAGLPSRPYDRSWVRSDAVFYGVDEKGVFRLRIGANGTERIGAADGRSIDGFQISTRKRWLQYDSSSSGKHWLYDIRAAREREVGSDAMDTANRAFSPDETRYAWLEAKGPQHSLVILDLRNFERQRFRLLEAPDPKAVFFDLTWSANGGRVTYAWRDAERQEFYGVDIATGIARSLPPPREFGADEFVEGSYLLGRGALTESAVRANAHPNIGRVALEGGANATIANGKITVSRPRQRPRVVAHVPASCNPSPGLLAAFDERYVLYRTDRTYWIYGLKENREAILYSGPSALDW